MRVVHENIWRLKSKISPVKKNKDWLISTLAKNRGLTSQKEFEEFKNPNFSEIEEVNIGNTQKAISRIKEAIDKKEQIIVYSDYDADGISATAIVWETLYDLGANVLPYVPHRIREGYGLSEIAIKELAQKGTKLILTVDHGVSAASQIEEAKKLGLDVIVTDHHVLPTPLPKPYALIHTTSLCGAGVAWKFCLELSNAIFPKYREKLMEKLELAAIATIADLVPLLGASRAIVKIGLEKLRKTKRPGLKSLIRVCNINGEIGTYEIGHILAPRINAMGRIEHGLDSLRLICAKNQKQADELAALLVKTNSKRQDLTTKAIEIALKMVDDDQIVPVLSHESWHEGVIGLVAARLVETFHKPIVVISQGETRSKGSARSIPGFNIVEAIRTSSQYLVDGGGHPMAAGFTIETRYIQAFAKDLNSYAATRITDGDLTRVIEIECEMEPGDVNRDTLGIIRLFEPFGVGNPQPVFLSRNIMVEDVRTVGQDNKHLKLQVDGLSAIGFNLGDWRAKIRPGYMLDLVYTIDEDRYAKDGRPQLKIKDLSVRT